MKNIIRYTLCLLLCLFGFVSTSNASLTVGQKFQFSTGDVIDAGGPNSRFLSLDKNYFSQKYTAADTSYYLYCLDPGLATPPSVKVYRLLMDSPDYAAQDYGALALVEFEDGHTESLAEIFEKGLAIRLLVDGIYGWTNLGVRTEIKQDLKGAAKAALEYCDDKGGVKGNVPSPVTLKTDGHGLIISDISSVGASTDGVIKYFCKGYHNYKKYEAGEVHMPNVSAKLIYKGTGQREGAELSPADKNYFIVEFIFENMSSTGVNGTFKLGNLQITDPSYDVQEIGASFNLSKTDFSIYDSGLLNSFRNSNAFNNAELLSHINEKGEVKIYVAVSASIDVPADEVLGKLYYSFSHEHSLSGAILVTDGDMDNSSRQRFIAFGGHGKESYVEFKAGTTCPFNGLLTVCQNNPEDKGKEQVNYYFKEGYFNGTEDVKKCIIGNSDEAGNDYKYLHKDDSDQFITNNRYCKIYCKEDYVFNVPYTRNTENGRYFQIRTAIAGSQECYSSKFDFDAFSDDAKRYQAEIVEAYNEWAFWHKLANTTPTTSTKFVSMNVTSCNNYGADCNCETCQNEDAHGNPIGTPYSCNCSSRATVNSYQENKYYGEIVFGNIFYNYSLETDGPYITISGGLSSLSSPDSGTESALDENLTRVYFGGAMHDPNGFKDNDLSGGDSCGDTTCSGTEENIFKTPEADYAAMKDKYVAKEKEAKQRLESASNDLKMVIDNYNACTGNVDSGHSLYYKHDLNWYVNFNFDPVVKYSYDEPNVPCVEDANYKAPTKWIELAREIDGDVMAQTEIVINQEKCTSFNGEACHNVSTVSELPFDSFDGTSSFMSGGSKAVKTYCDGNVDKGYNCEGDSSSSNYNTSYGFIDVVISGSGVTMDKHYYPVTNIDYVSTAATAFASYDTKSIYYTGSPDGEIKVSAKTLEDGNFSLVQGLPVSIRTPDGTYYYKLIFDNIGNYFSSNKLGRVYGTESTSLSSINEVGIIERYNNDPGSCKADDNYNRETVELEQNEYACIYNVNDGDTESGDKCVHLAKGYCVCEDEKCNVEKTCYEPTREGRESALRDVGCDPNDDNCPNNYNCCPFCTITCVGVCIYDSKDWGYGESMLEFRSINDATVNPNERQLGYNWDSGGYGTYDWSTANVENVLVAQKAGITTEQIQSHADIVDIDEVDESSVETMNADSLTIKLTPEVANYVRKYNTEQENNGAYNNDTLDCKDYVLPDGEYNETKCKDGGFTWYPTDPLNPKAGDGKCIMKNIMCYSTFLDELINEFGDKVVQSKTRADLLGHPGYDANKEGAPAKFSVNIDYKNDPYKTSLKEIQMVNGYWGIYLYDSLDVDNDHMADIGPSWR